MEFVAKRLRTDIAKQMWESIQQTLFDERRFDKNDPRRATRKKQITEEIR